MHNWCTRHALNTLKIVSIFFFCWLREATKTPFNWLHLPLRRYQRMETKRIGEMIGSISLASRECCDGGWFSLQRRSRRDLGLYCWPLAEPPNYGAAEAIMRRALDIRPQQNPLRGAATQENEEQSQILLFARANFSLYNLIMMYERAALAVNQVWRRRPLPGSLCKL